MYIYVCIGFCFKGVVDFADLIFEASGSSLVLDALGRVHTLPAPTIPRLMVPNFKVTDSEPQNKIGPLSLGLQVAQSSIPWAPK